MDGNDSKEVQKWHDATLVPRYGLKAPNQSGKDVGDSGDLLALQTFNIAYDTGIFPLERHRLQLSACYLILACTGARPAEVVDNEKTKQFGHLGELFEPEAVEAGLDNGSRLSQVARGRPKRSAMRTSC
jgi:hypothetical protein